MSDARRGEPALVEKPFAGEISGPAFFIGKGAEDGLLSFGSGQPDLPPPSEAYGILNKYDGFRYGPVAGDPGLRTRLAADYVGSSSEDFVITNGASEAIDLALRALFVPGAKVLLPRPYYYSYPRNVELAGMTPKYLDLGEDGKIDFDAFAKEVEGCRAVIINSPSNPTGAVQDVAVLKRIEELCDRLGIYVISDEVYKDLIYDRENYLIKGQRVITVNSFSKTYAMCGLRVGYLYAREPELIGRIIEMKSHTSMNTSIVSQAMALAALSAPESYVASHLSIWKERRDRIYDGMRALGLELARPEGAFYVLPKFKHSGRVVSDLFHKHKVITYDGAWFGAPGHVRFSYALDVAKIDEGLTRLKRFLETDYANY
jgi:aspartate aminotransferase